MKIVICASEMVPFAKTGGLADVAGALPLALEKAGEEVIVIMPHYKGIPDAKFAISKLKNDIYHTVIGKKIKVYFIDNEVYFRRDSLYGDKAGDYSDNLERFSFFCKRALELLKAIDFKPQVIHCHDWQTALLPVYLKNYYAKDNFYQDVKTVFTIHNIGYQGLFPKEDFPKLGLDWDLYNMEGLEFFGRINVLKGGLLFSDIINTVSPTYSREIQSAKFGFGLEGVLAQRKDSLFGIINGIDYSIWSPEKDQIIAKNYSFRDLKSKGRNKEALQKLCKLPVKKEVPFFGIVSRLAEQKGFDILAEGINHICKMDLQLVILGTGNLKYHLLMEEMVKKYPEVISLFLKFDDALAHKIYAGSDIFLMPSSYEPCGLGQLISLSYGTIPLVFKTGGLADTVNASNGFVFDKYSSLDLIKTVKKAIKVYADKTKWAKLQEKAMQCNFSWEGSAKEYIKLYEKASQKK